MPRPAARSRPRASPNLDARERLLAAAPEIYFTIPHFAGYPAVLVRLPEIGREELRELITEAWILRAPKRLVAAWEKGSGQKESGR
jgi:hypothetical protein